MPVPSGKMLPLIYVSAIQISNHFMSCQLPPMDVVLSLYSIDFHVTSVDTNFSTIVQIGFHYSSTAFASG